MSFSILLQFNIIVFKINIQLQRRLELFSSHQYSIKYTNSFFQILTQNNAFHIRLYAICSAEIQKHAFIYIALSVFSSLSYHKKKAIRVIDNASHIDHTNPYFIQIDYSNFRIFINSISAYTLRKTDNNSVHFYLIIYIIPITAVT